jgi:hypothetical protein
MFGGDSPDWTTNYFWGLDALIRAILIRRRVCGKEFLIVIKKRETAFLDQPLIT